MFPRRQSLFWMVLIMAGVALSASPASEGRHFAGYYELSKAELTPQEQIEGVIDKLQNIVDSDTPAAGKAADAIAKLQTALDGLNKTPPDNQAALGNIEGAVGDLEAASGLDSAQDDPTLTDCMDQLAGIAQQLAADAIEQAIARGGDSIIVAEAQQFLFDGDDLRASGALKDAVARYKDALAAAEGA